MAAPKKTKAQPPATVQNFPIVGIGASAGGLDAFKSLLSAIPESSGMAYVLVQHLDPSHESVLPEILQRVTKIPVHEITDDIHLAPDHIYIIPSNKILTSTDGVLQLSPRDKKILNLSIDVFFTSLAAVHKEFAVGVVLSGTGSDGTLGLKAIKEHGGISIAQDPESAAYDSMPKNAVNAGVVDFILAPEKIPSQLLQIKSAYKTNHFFIEKDQLPKDDDDNFKQILLLLRQRSGVDFSNYKQPTFHRRIARRIAISKKENLADYLGFLRKDKVEQDALFLDVLIPVTSFFRDPKTFQELSETVFPALLKHKITNEPIRVWIAGCSTGEEAFSIAICLHEFLGEKLNSQRIQIFASDISEKAIKKARVAIYSKADVENLSATQLKNYFKKNNGDYQVDMLIRDMCVFAPHNFLKDPPFAKMDLISCRNVLIYMDTFLQKKAFSTFHYALKENGFLLLGKSETIGASSELFTQISKRDKIYSRKPSQGRFIDFANESREAALTKKAKTGTEQEIIQTDFKKSAEAVMISKSPAGVVVNEQMDIVHIHGDITPFLQTPQGKPTHNLIKMAREGLEFELRNAIHKATKELTTVTKVNIPVKANEKQSLVTIEIIPLTDTIEPHYLIRFVEKTIPFVQEEKKSASGKTNETQKHNQHLEKELSQTREDMRSITEDMEAFNEELQGANEELQSSNEEMQSLNEELETSKEELQSTNEELLIVNQELLDKQLELNASRYYAESIVTTIRHPLIVLDNALRIKSANAAFYDAFNAIEDETERKLFYEIQNKQWDDAALRSLLEKILRKKERLIDFEITLQFPLLGERNMLFNARQIENEHTSEQLILLAIEDVTEKRLTEERIRQSEEKFKSIFDNSLAAVLVADDQGNYISANKAASKLLGYTINELLQMNVSGLKTTAQPRAKDRFDEYIRKGEETGEFGFISKTGTHKIALYQATLISPDFNLIILMDISEQKEVSEKLKATAIELAVKNKLIEESEKRFSNILLQSIMSIGILQGTDMIVSFANDPLLATWGKGKDIIGKPLLEVLPELKDQIYPNLLQQVYTTGEPFYGHETKAVLIRNGKEETMYYNFIFQPYTEVDNSVTGITILATEVTEQVLAKKQTEESEKRFRELSESLEVKIKERTAKLLITNEELKQTNMQLDQFAHIASHDLQEPLRKISIFSSLLQKKHEDELSTEIKSYLNKIESSSSRMSTLIRDLLNYSRLLQHEKLFVPTDLNETLKNILSDFELLIYEKKAQIKFDELPTIDAIPLQMNQLFYNLISNALKFSKEDVLPIISITSRTLTEKQIQKYPAFNPFLSYIEIVFEDNGIGFEQKYAGKIFNIFQRLHDKETFFGTGIGLAITKKIIEVHHGDIFADAEENRGASFHVILPITQP